MYLPERDILVYLLNNEYFRTYFEYVELDYIKENHRELFHIYKAVQALHEKFPNKDHTLQGLQAFFFASYPDVDKELYTELFKTLQEAQIDPTLGVGILKQIKRRKQALKLSEESFKYATGQSDAAKVTEHVKFLEEDTDEEVAEEEYGMDLETILDSAILKPGLRWRLNCLNKSLGSLRDGDFGFIFKRPEVGGTAFCASEVGYMLDQAERPIMWFNNEETDNKVKLRIFQSYFGITLEQLIANKKKWNEEFRRRTEGKFIFCGLEDCNKRKVEELVKRHKPQLVLYDQLDKVRGFEADRDDLKLGAIYQWARELCKQGHAGIGVTQADGTAEGIKWLTMQYVANAKTSKQAEGDWVMGIGRTHADGAEYTRYLSICKNKLLGDTDTLPDLRHGRFEVFINPAVMRFEDIVKYD